MRQPSAIFAGFAATAKICSLFPKLAAAVTPELRAIAFERRVIIAYKVLPAGDIYVGRVLYGDRNYEALLDNNDD